MLKRKLIVATLHHTEFRACDCLCIPIIKAWPAVYAAYMFVRLVYFGYIIVKSKTTLFIFRQ